MEIPAAILGPIVLAILIVDAFNTIILARRAEHIFRVARGYYAVSRQLWGKVAHHIKSSQNREAFLGVFEPLSLLVRVVIRAVALIFAFGLLQWRTYSYPQRFR